MATPTYVQELARRIYRELVTIDNAEAGVQAFAAWVVGYKQAAADYAVWQDGTQYVGVQRRPLSELLDELDDEAKRLVPELADDEAEYDPAEGRPQGPADAFNPSTTHRVERDDGTHERHRGTRELCSLCNQ